MLYKQVGENEVKAEFCNLEGGWDYFDQTHNF